LKNTLEFRKMAKPASNVSLNNITLENFLVVTLCLYLTIKNNIVDIKNIRYKVERIPNIGENLKSAKKFLKSEILGLSPR